MRTRIAAVLAAILMLAGLCGCTPRLDVFFQNNTDQDLVLRTRNPDNPVAFDLPAGKTSVAEIAAEGECTSDWLVYDKAGIAVVKDPGRVCGRQTITIP